MLIEFLAALDKACMDDVMAFFSEDVSFELSENGTSPNSEEKMHCADFSPSAAKSRGEVHVCLGAERYSLVEGVLNDPSDKSIAQLMASARLHPSARFAIILG
jgi:hypothetical protein